ncbi:B-type flagellin [Roseimaritima multifibrata]|uniref:Flagellin n=1 Tax=Roseimaritima multifibrata TaxID=1930274 RepID=A0A517MFH1_9BACT|nr:flagellin [Roseimaritima multifibrata]QDS93635.1 B-type flagellin [Roseimaritima multifibrata]
MTRINTNVPSLIAQNRLQASNSDLQEALTRLSTGLRINSGADDPAGLIASEALRSEINGLNKAISNTQRASQIISTADSALGQVSNLLSDIRGLVVEAANAGALSPDEIDANQLQVDSSLEALNRIAQTTTFQGRKLLDGSLDFISSVGTVDSVTDAHIDQANLGATGSINVNVNISEAAEQASITSSGGAFTTGANANVAFSFTNQSLTVETDIAIAADSSIAAGTTLTFLDSATDSDGNALAVGAAEAVYDSTNNTITVRGNGDTTTKADVAAAIDALQGFEATGGAGTVGFSTTTVSGTAFVPTTPALTITADDTGAEFNDVNVEFVSGASNVAAYDEASKTLTVTVDSSAPQSLADIKAAIDLTEFNATVDTAGELNIANTVVSSAGTGDTGGEVLSDDLIFELTGTDGSETFNFQAGASLTQIQDAINLVSDATGVTAEKVGGTLTFSTESYGSDAKVAIDIISEGASRSFETSLSSNRSIGKDVVAQINGTLANGRGNTLSLNTSTLDLTLSVKEGSSIDFSFQITGGGAQFQLGAEVVSNQQARMGISSVSTGKLGGVNGRLYELGSGQAKSLVTDPAGASRIVDEVITKVTSLRGRLGAFQATTLESNLVSLNDTVANLQEAESSIRDADFAVESAKLTRSQILVQSGTNVLALANQNPQNVLQLLQ